MVKITFCLKRLPHLSAQDFQKHWCEIHAPLVRKHQKALRIVRYVQFHSDLGPLTEKLRAFRHSPEPYDGVAEIGTKAAKRSKNWERTPAPGPRAASYSKTRSALSISPDRQSSSEKRKQ